jgi:Fe(3+) dicitrate transport protein
VRVAREDRLSDADSSTADLAVLPGLAIHYEILEGFGLLAGVHRGFSPVAPGQAEEVTPEFAINYEFGLRYQRSESQTLLEAIGFVSDYSNIVGQCTFSSGCAVEDLDKQFNGGEAFIAGLEVVAQHTFDLPKGYQLPIRASYTYTNATFQSSFTSSNPQFGEVSEGDSLPYVAPHQAAVSIGLQHEMWAINLGLTYFDRMRETAGTDDGPKTDAAWLFDASLSYRPLNWLDLYVTGENLANQQVVASRRPFGARPIRPLQLLGGIRLRYD